jgi:LPS export ABC transporter protein LptC
MSDSETPTRRADPTPVDPSPQMRRNRAIQRFRWIVLLAMAAAVVAVVGLYLSGRSDRPTPSDEDELDAESMEPIGEMVTVGEGFERTVTEGNRQLFTVRGERYSVDKKGIIFLEGVDVVVYREEGGEYRVGGEKARFDMDKREGRIAGGVRISAPDGMTLRTESLRVTDDGNQIRTRSPVAFEIGEGYQGTAEGLRAWISARRYLLEGLVQIDSRAGAEEPLHIKAKGLILERSRHLLSSQDWAVLRRRGERLSALEMHFFFSDDERTLRFVRAERKVTGVLRSGGSVDLGDTGARRIGFQAGKMTLLMAEDGRSPQKLELERIGRQRPRVYTLGPKSAPRYRLTAGTISAWFDAMGSAERALAEGGAVLVMNEPGHPMVDEDSLGAEPVPEEEGAEAGEGGAGPAEAP